MLTWKRKTNLDFLPLYFWHEAYAGFCNMKFTPSYVDKPKGNFYIDHYFVGTVPIENWMTK